MSIKDRGFASMERQRHRALASQGGREAHRSGHAHEWNHEEAKAAARKSVQVRRAKRLDAEKTRCAHIVH